eukprot:GDKJ01056198.1.p1 GENE.GDKJ01056198.1~~GDKJ01056198.1.p1  ORF type:complete len:632 (-),score=160.30 GDKJ01056198.1:256-2151(-)
MSDSDGEWLSIKQKKSSKQKTSEKKPTEEKQNIETVSQTPDRPKSLSIAEQLELARQGKDKQCKPSTRAEIGQTLQELTESTKKKHSAVQSSSASHVKSVRPATSTTTNLIVSPSMSASTIPQMKTASHPTLKSSPPTQHSSTTNQMRTPLKSSPLVNVSAEPFLTPHHIPAKVLTAEAPKKAGTKIGWDLLNTVTKKKKEELSALERLKLELEECIAEDRQILSNLDEKKLIALLDAQREEVYVVQCMYDLESVNGNSSKEMYSNTNKNSTTDEKQINENKNTDCRTLENGLFPPNGNFEEPITNLSDEIREKIRVFLSEGNDLKKETSTPSPLYAIIRIRLQSSSKRSVNVYIGLRATFPYTPVKIVLDESSLVCADLISMDNVNAILKQQKSKFENAYAKKDFSSSSMNLCPLWETLQCLAEEVNAMDDSLWDRVMEERKSHLRKLQQQEEEKNQQYYNEEDEMSALLENQNQSLENDSNAENEDDEDRHEKALRLKSRMEDIKLKVQQTASKSSHHHHKEQKKNIAAYRSSSSNSSSLLSDHSAHDDFLRNIPQNQAVGNHAASKIRLISSPNASPANSHRIKSPSPFAQPLNSLPPPQPTAPFFLLKLLWLDLLLQDLHFCLRVLL